MTIALTADERTRSRYRYRISNDITDGGRAGIDLSTTDKATSPLTEIYLELPRGTLLRHYDCLVGDDHQQVLRIVAKSEPVLTVRAATDARSMTGPPTAHAQTSVQLLKAAYHLGNRHVALEVGHDYLRLAPDPVLEAMLHQLGVVVTSETAPFQPESGAYGHHH